MTHANTHLCRQARMALATIAVSAAMLVLTSQARAAASDCAPVQAAVALLYKTPFHVKMTKAATRTGAFPTSADEAVWAGGRLYMKLSDKRWLNTQVAPDNVLGSLTGSVSNYRTCRRLGDDAVHGEATAVYAATMESGTQAQLWVSTKSGLLLRDVLDQDIVKVTAEFDFANIRAPATQ
jgi:hypothetical protein